MNENNTNTTHTTTNMEQNINNAPFSAKGVARFNRPISIHIHSIRNRLTDPDGLCAKYVVDAIVSAGILSDDSAKEIYRISYSQEKTKGAEQTIITIKEV